MPFVVRGLVRWCSAATGIGRHRVRLFVVGAFLAGGATGHEPCDVHARFGKQFSPMHGGHMLFQGPTGVAGWLSALLRFGVPVFRVFWACLCPKCSFHSESQYGRRSAQNRQFHVCVALFLLKNAPRHKLCDLNSKFLHISHRPPCSPDTSPTDFFVERAQDTARSAFSSNAQ